MATGRAFRAYGCMNSCLMVRGKRSEGDMLVIRKTRTISAMSADERFHGAQQYQMTQPVMAMM